MPEERHRDTEDSATDRGSKIEDRGSRRVGILDPLFSILCSLGLGGVLLAQTVALSKEPVVLDASATSPFATLWGRVPVELGEVKAQPTRGGRPIEVEAEAWLDRTNTDLGELESVAVFYSLDQGQTWQTAPLKRAAKSSGAAKPPPKERRWTGRIPAQRKGARVIFYVQAQDNFGQITREIPSFYSSPSRAALVAKDAEESQAHSELVPPDLDLLETYAAYDADYLWIGQTVKGNLEKGALDKPFAPYLYAIFLVNPDDAEVYEFSDAPALLYLPLGQLAQLPTYGLVRLDRLFGPRRAEALLPDADTRFELRKGEDGVARTMWFRIKRSALGANPSGRLRLVGVSTAFLDLKRPSPIPWEASPFATFYFRAHEVEVQ